MGTTGTGKDILANEISSYGLERSIRPTTRPKREGELDTIYEFLVKDVRKPLLSYDWYLSNGFIICDRVHGDKGWHYGIQSSVFDQAVDTDNDFIITLDRLTALDLYKELMDRGISKNVFFVSVSESEPKSQALDRILEHRLIGKEEYDSFITEETARRLDSDSEDVLNTLLLGSHMNITSLDISKAIKKDNLPNVAKMILDGAIKHWSEMEEVKHDFDF